MPLILIITNTNTNTSTINISVGVIIIRRTIPTSNCIFGCCYRHTNTLAKKLSSNRHYLLVLGVHITFTYTGMWTIYGPSCLSIPFLFKSIRNLTISINLTNFKELLNIFIVGRNFIYYQQFIYIRIFIKIVMG